jgi:hypothetical protein
MRWVNINSQFQQEQIALGSVTPSHNKSVSNTSNHQGESQNSLPRVSNLIGNSEDDPRNDEVEESPAIPVGPHKKSNHQPNKGGSRDYVK